MIALDKETAPVKPATSGSSAPAKRSQLVLPWTKRDQAVFARASDAAQQEVCERQVQSRSMAAWLPRGPVVHAVQRYPTVWVSAPRAVAADYWSRPWADVVDAADRGHDGLTVVSAWQLVNRHSADWSGRTVVGSTTRLATASSRLSGSRRLNGTASDSPVFLPFTPVFSRFRPPYWYAGANAPHTQMATESFPPGIDGDRRLSVSVCRSLLDDVGPHLSNEAIAAMRDQLYAVAIAAVSIFERDSDEQPDAAILPALRPEQREAVEERAAVLEFDAHMPRGAALRAALAAHGIRTERENERDREGRDLLPRLDKRTGSKPVTSNAAPPVPRILRSGKARSRGGLRGRRRVGQDDGSS